MLSPGQAFADRTFDAILFDMDGTLISSIEAVDRSWARWAVEHGFGADFRIAHGTPARSLVESLVAPEQVEAALARVTEIEISDTDGVRVLPGAAELLASLPRDRHAIVTSCTRDLAAVRIAATGISAPDVVVTADDITRGKPDPEPFRRGAELLGFAPERCLVVEDAPAGLASGRSAGCATLAVAGTHTLDELDADAHAPGASAVAVRVNPDGSLTLEDRSL